MKPTTAVNNNNNESSHQSPSPPPSKPTVVVPSTLPIYSNGAYVDWKVPPLRKGLLGRVDHALGPGFLLSELLVTLSALTFAIGYLLAVIFPQHPEWSLVRKVWVGFFAANAGWGTVTSTGSFKRWYHHEGGDGISGLDLAICFSDVSSQFLICNLLFLDDLAGEWWFASQYIAFLFTAFSLFRLVPFYLRRPTNVAMLMAGGFLATHTFPRIPGMEWFPFVILTKNLLHINREEPYSPPPPISPRGTDADRHHHHQQ